jgi:hypothetical protein
MEAFLISLSTVALAEVGDRTQMLSLLLVTRFRRPWPILSGVFVATLANHALAGVIGVSIGHRLRPAILDAAVGISMIAMALWMLKPDKLKENDGKRTQKGVFLTTLVAFFIADARDSPHHHRFDARYRCRFHQPCNSQRVLIRSSRIQSASRQKDSPCRRRLMAAGLLCAALLCAAQFFDKRSASAVRRIIPDQLGEQRKLLRLRIASAPDQTDASTGVAGL